ncbi:MAG TPA: hypothetical protein VLL06_07675 [Nitrospiraceae bacterium]|nr:hypothetical protein [Nitrospiraceae bacterium]
MVLPKRHGFDANDHAYLARIHDPYVRPNAQRRARTDLHPDFQWAQSLDQQRGTHDGIVT